MKYIKAPFICLLKAEAEGKKGEDESKMTFSISHEDPYFITAASAVSCLVQYLNLKERKVGLFRQGSFVEPIEFFKDLKRMGVSVELKQELSIKF